jgi:hypothetical protein
MEFSTGRLDSSYGIFYTKKTFFFLLFGSSIEDLKRWRQEIYKNYECF